MNGETKSSARQAALIELLDDPSPSVRKALLTEFKKMGGEGIRFLQDIGRGPNRLIGRFASRYLNELKFADPIAEFRDFIRSLNYELETGMYLMARTLYPEFTIAESCSHLDSISARCRQLIAEPMSIREKCRVINRVVFHEYGFVGNVEHYSDPRNSFFNQVLERRKGIPISLSILYILVADRCGIRLEPIAVPGHFMVGCFDEREPFFIDPFQRGLLRTPDDVFGLIRSNNLVPKVSDLAPSPVREVLCRSCRNLAQHFTAAHDFANARLFAGFVEEFEAVHRQQVRG
ncbi:MAG: transglutaminase-like domain-containing protein [Opitutaceae bacterium]